MFIASDLAHFFLRPCSIAWAVFALISIARRPLLGGRKRKVRIGRRPAFRATMAAAHPRVLKRLGVDGGSDSTDACTEEVCERVA